MKAPVLFASLAALAITAIAPAQQPAPSFGVAGMEPTVQNTQLVVTVPPAACPVSLKASFNADGQMVKVRKPGAPDPGPSAGPSQHIRIVLADPAHNAIVSATVTAYGLTARPRVDRSSDPFVKGPSNVRRTVTVSFSASGKGTHSADVELPGFTAVHGVKLESMRFADGSVRTFADKTMCSVPVDPLMLVSER